MPIIGMNYKKITAERKAGRAARVNINTTPKIADVKKTSLKGLGQDLEVLNVDFSFVSEVQPDVGKIVIEGTVVYRTAGAKQTKEILDSWKKKKALPAERHVEIVNHLFRKVSLLALQLGDALGLPPVVGLPRVARR